MQCISMGIFVERYMEIVLHLILLVYIGKGSNDSKLVIMNNIKDKKPGETVDIVKVINKKNRASN